MGQTHVGVHAEYRWAPGPCLGACCVPTQLMEWHRGQLGCQSLFMHVHTHVCVCVCAPPLLCCLVPAQPGV